MVFSGFIFPIRKFVVLAYVNVIAKLACTLGRITHMASACPFV